MSIFGAKRKVFAAVLLGITLSVQLAILAPKIAFAIPVEDSAGPASDQARDAIGNVKKSTEMSLTGVIFTAIVNLLTFAANRLAYDAAVMLASGGPDDQPLIEYRSAEAFFADYASAVAGEAVGLVSENLDEAGLVLSNFNLCTPSNPKVTLALKMGIRSSFRRPEPLCEFTDIKKNWAGYIAQVASDSQDGVFKSEMILTQLKDSFDPQTQEFSVGIQLYSDVLGKALQDADIAKNKLLIQGPTKDVVDVITGNVKTPASLINNDFFAKVEGKREKQDQIMHSLLNNKEALLQIGISAASTFANTLLSQMTNKLYSGFFDFDTVETDPFDVGFSSTTTREDAQARFSSLLAVSPLSVTDYDILGQFGSCPRDNRGLYNCVADTNFISAVARAETGAPLTVQEAMDESLISGSWPLIPSADQARDQDTYCYTYGFCHSNLVKMRKSRIISVGWELAAETAQNSVDDPVTLQEVIDGYDDCSVAGERDDNHPWCKLIDPNWVLKYPETQCRALVYGQLLETSAAAARQEECVDMPSCIAEDENGVCTGGFGYCVREENIWNFRGDSCPAYAASCLTFEDMEGENQSFLLTTVDYGSCDEGSAGCLWYATEKNDDDGDGAYDWPTVSDVATADEAADTYLSRLYLTAEVEECDEEDGGCSELYERTDDLRLNVIPNPSLEDDDDSDGVPDSWLVVSGGTPTYDTAGDYARSGDAAVNPGTANVYQEGLTIEQGATYTLSYYARQDDGATGVEASMTISFVNEDDATEAIDLNGLAASSGCAVSSGDDSVMEVNDTPTGETYERIECTLTAPILADASDRLLAYVDIMQGDVWIDDIQLEQGEDSSDYHAAYNDDAEVIVAKVAPSYLGCTGDATDPDACDDYAQVCSESQVGCTQYSPSNGDPEVFGITDDTDVCPSTCVGYDTFKQEPTRYEPDGDFPVYFIPSTADECDESSVGCDEFTKLDDESLAYFTYVRACLTTDQANANPIDEQDGTFYTWEGSDLDGYQLKTWILLESDMEVATATYAGSGNTETDPGAAPCTSWTTGEEGVTCNDDVLAVIGEYDMDTAECDQHDDIFENPDCREFYDVAGNIHYREWSSTVTVNDACTSYRKTDLAGINEDSNGDTILDNLNASANCTESGGYFDDVLATCRYYAYGEESTSCTEKAAGCREYTGGRSRNSRIVLEEQFEDGDLTVWEAASASDVTYSNESIATDGHSLASIDENVWSYLYNNGTACAETVEGEGCASPTDDGTLGGDCTVENGEQYCGTLTNELYAGKTYTVSFWAKGTGNVEVGFDIAADPTAAEIGSGDPSFGTAALSASSWQEFQLGPLDIDEDTYAGFDDGNTVLVFAPATGVSFYVDNIVLREGEDNITVIKDSWVTPAACDEAPDGTSSPQYYLGCQEYTTQESETVYLKSFSSLCSEDVVGCTAYFGTHESESPYAEVYGATCAALTDVPVDVATDCYKLNDGAGNYDTDSPYLCTIGVGLTSCTFDLEGYIPVSALTVLNKMDHLSYGSSTHVVDSDTPHFLVVDDEDECSTNAAGCTELGLPTFSADRQTVDESTSVYVMNTPSDYDEILCSHEDLFCAAWDAGEDGTYYFKDPQDQVCEYRTDVTVGGTSYDGWFRSGTSDFCYGTCSVGGNSCSSDADCSSGDTCDASVGSYVISGDQSGIWRNGDDAYGGWVGGCSEQYSSCTAFEDVLDISEGAVYGSEDGTSYHYLDNVSLEEGTLASAQKCNGQVSQKLGCGLFLDTTDTGRNYNASASYVASEHADALFGDAPFALVDPISCEDGGGEIIAQNGTTVDLCSNRCLYDNADVYDLGTAYTDPYTFGASCYTASDCSGVTSEAGEVVSATCGTATVALENDSNRVLKVNRDRQCSEWLSCEDTRKVWDAASGSYKLVCGDVSLCDEYSSDGNASFCSSWASDSVAAVLDVDRYADRDVSWYGDDYSGYAIPDAFPVELLVQVNVAAPSGYCDLSEARNADGSAYAFETSAIHGIECTATGNECDVTSVTGEECVSSDEPVYDLVYNAGYCEEAYGVSCTVGYCQNTGESCSTTDDCGIDEGSCVIGTCYDKIEGSSCSDDSGCSDGFSCLSGECVDELGDLDVAYTSCSDAVDADYPLGGYTASVGTLTLYDSILTKSGACVRDLCLLTANGVPYDVTDLGSQECRGYPEQDSPFANEVVEEWKNPDPRTDSSDTAEYAMSPVTSDIVTDADGDGVVDTLAIAPDLEPYNFVTGFEQVKTCQAGEDCVCSYDKVTYGTADVRYYEDASEYPEPSGAQLGICVGGKYDGTYCRRSTDEIVGVDTIHEDTCEDATVGGGTCNYATRKDTVTGLEGYCLERDTSININGNRDDDHRACITWLPVDELVGSTDIYAKHLTAGYFDDSYICTDVRAFVDVYPTGSIIGSYSTDHAPSPGDIACAETAADFDNFMGEGVPDGTDEWGVNNNNAASSYVFYNGDSSKKGCAERAACPDGFWAMMGQPSADKGSDTLAEACDGNGGFEVNDCPYTCIPYGAYVNDEGTERSCDPGSGGYIGEALEEAFVYGGSIGSQGWTDGSPYTGGNGTQVYVIAQSIAATDRDDSDGGEHEFDKMVELMQHCRAVGVPYDDNFVSDDVYNFPVSSGFASGETGFCVYADAFCTDAEADCGAGNSCHLGMDPITFLPETRCVATGGGCTSDAQCGAFGTCSVDAEENSGSDEDSHGYRYLYVQRLDGYPGCMEATQVSGDDGGVWKSYAWTDRVKNAGTSFEGIAPTTDTTFSYTRDVAPIPYGITLESPASRSTTYPPFIPAVCDEIDGADYYVPAEASMASGATCPAGYEETIIRTGYTVTSSATAEARSYIDFRFGDPPAYSSTSGNTGRDPDTLWTTWGDSTDVFGRITQVFAFLGFGESHTWTGGVHEGTGTLGDTLGYETGTSTYGGATASADSIYDARPTEGNPPTIWALDLANCEGDACEEGEEGALTLNSGSSGDYTSSEFFRAYLKFYAAADKNQLPIRRVIVDWQFDDETGSAQQDLTGSETDNNFYKNHRGLQDGSGDSKCTLGSEWGLNADSCQGDYFDYSHIYTCSQGTVNALEDADRQCTYDSNGYVTNSPCVDGGACVFRPRVHVRDNWGWCTGVCEEGSSYDEDHSTGCYDGYQDTSFMATNYPQSECAYLYYPSTSGTASENDPWVYYDGNIIVTP